LEIKWLGTGVSKQSKFRQQVESILRKRYGKPFRISDHIVFRDFDWKINSNATVTLRPLGNAVLVTYRDTVLANLSEKEKLGQVRRGFTINDKSKF
jgi:Zn-finger domain-containing protein